MRTRQGRVTSRLRSQPQRRGLTSLEVDDSEIIQWEEADGVFLPDVGRANNKTQDFANLTWAAKSSGGGGSGV